MSETQDLQQQQWREQMQQQLQWDWTPMQIGELEQTEDSTEDSTEDWMDWTSTTYSDGGLNTYACDLLH